MLACKSLTLKLIFCVFSCWFILHFSIFSYSFISRRKKCVLFGYVFFICRLGEESVRIKIFFLSYVERKIHTGSLSRFVCKKESQRLGSRLGRPFDLSLGNVCTLSLASRRTFSPQKEHLIPRASSPALPSPHPPSRTHKSGARPPTGKRTSADGAL